MITEAFFALFMNILNLLFSALPDIQWSCDALVYKNAISLISGVVYLLPTSAVVGIVSFIITLQIFRLSIAGVKTIWDLLPIL